MSLPILARNRGGSFAAGPAAPAGGAHEVTRQNDLVVWYKMDETSGDTVSDSSENGYHATAINMDDDDWITGKNGNALDFDGTDDHFVDGAASKTIAHAMGAGDSLLDAKTDDSQGPYSVSFWLKQSTNTESGVYSVVDAWDSGGGAFSRGRVLASGADIRVGFGSISTAPWYVYTNLWTPDSNWHHLVCTFSGSVWKTYRNGSLDNTATKYAYYDADGSQQLHVGNSWPATGAKGVEDFRIYNVVLSLAEIGDIYGHDAEGALDGSGDWG